MVPELWLSRSLANRALMVHMVAFSAENPQRIAGTASLLGMHHRSLAVTTLALFVFVVVYVFLVAWRLHVANKLNVVICELADFDIVDTS